MNKAHQILAAAGLSLMAAGAQADEAPISFNYAQISYSSIDLTTTEDDEVSGLSFTLSQGFSDVNYIFAELDMGETDKSKEDYQRLSIGLGVHLLKNESTTNPTEVYLGASYEQKGLEKGDTLNDDEGFGLRLGFRSMAWSSIELGVELGLDKFDDSEAYGITGTIGYRVIDNLGIYGSYSYDDITPENDASAIGGDNNAVTKTSIGVRGIW